jgi:hypothetical protein
MRPERVPGMAWSRGAIQEVLDAMVRHRFTPAAMGGSEPHPGEGSEMKKVVEEKGIEWANYAADPRPHLSI